jgi:hypothetical protein
MLRLEFQEFYAGVSFHWVYNLLLLLNATDSVLPGEFVCNAQKHWTCPLGVCSCLVYVEQIQGGLLMAGLCRSDPGGFVHAWSMQKRSRGVRSCLVYVEQIKGGSFMPGLCRLDEGGFVHAWSM